jgi:hypothetical protein
MPFTIEYLCHGSVVERMTSFASQIADAEQSARAGMARVRIMRPDTPPDGYRVLDNDGSVIVGRAS